MGLFLQAAMWPLYQQFFTVAKKINEKSNLVSDNSDTEL